MIREMLLCDECGKPSEDICGDVDWIRIETGSQNAYFSISDGRRDKPNDTTHKTKICKRISGNADFCCEECMLKWMGLDSEKEPHVVEYMLLTTLKRTKDGDVFDVVAKKE